jgi:uncharacterized protein YciI
MVSCIMTLLRTSALLAGLAVSVASALAQAPASPPPATPPAPLYAAVFKTGPKWDPAKPPNEQTAFRDHSANLARLRAAGAIVMGARYGDVGLVVVSAATEAEARKLFEADPSVSAGTFSLEVYRFSVFYPGTVGTPAAPK